MLTRDAMEAARQIIALTRVIEACRGTLESDSATEDKRERAELTLLAAHEILNRLKYVIDAEDAAEMRKRFEEIGTFKVPVE